MIDATLQNTHQNVFFGAYAAVTGMDKGKLMPEYTVEYHTVEYHTVEYHTVHQPHVIQWHVRLRYSATPAGLSACVIDQNGMTS